ncbi:hypothetical protein [Curtobacterium sp. MCPF17_046]|uniref:hypothetical protein n=1 Tax=Curtobacterium sp. MCPF17_046 TaxID=2175663 RepID=UPI000D9D5BF3|nr:hypothetical protein [Curtobacterium sp. MCPF17_046]PYY38838.1 hypothetical protein DEJ32_10385 [Curtobacterium sp. MCPF17_046]
MREEHKDAVQDAAVELAGVALSFVPVAGSLLAGALGIAAGSAAQRRTDRILKEVVLDLQRLQAERQLPTADVMQSDAFLAAAERTVRRLIEAEGEEKRKLLRNALLNVSSGQPVDVEFERWLDRLDADDIRVAAAVEDLMRDRGQLLEAAPSQVSRWFEQTGGTEPTRIRDRIRGLVNEGVLQVTSDGAVEDVEVGGRAGSRTEHRVRSTYFHDITDRGIEFLAYVRDPLA